MKAAEKFYQWSHALTQAIYPWKCCVCGSTNQGGVGVCNACTHYLPWCAYHSLCSSCGLPIAASMSVSKICGACQKIPPFYDSTHANFWYQSPIDNLISGYKYFNQWQNAHTLVNLSAKNFSDIAKTGLVIPMPSHPARVRERGFNAVFELIKLFRKEIHFDYSFNCVSRTKNTQTQTNKLKSQRRQNVKNAFKVTNHIDYDHVIIFDEVVTTAASVNELSRCLKKSGVEQVSVYAIARTK